MSPPAAAHAPRAYRYYDLIMAAFVCVLLCANLIGVSKIAQVSIFGYTKVFGAGNLFFPLSYLFGDILTEVYGYARSRKVVWAGFSALMFASIMSWVVVHLPPAQGWAGQPIIEQAFGSTWRIA
ncbi:MAG TPA: VUT family protein, partial [Polyangiales bacterium]|nr:VUT family protein [Polyangiales bacterium]